MKYIFDPEILREISQSRLGLPLEEKLEAIAQDLAEQYPGLIETKPQWVLSNAGGAMGQTGLLHASLREYVSLYGSPIDSGGHSGRYSFVDQYAIVIHGEMWCFSEGDLSRKEYRPGDVGYLGRSEAKGYRFVNQCWIIEYVRGSIVTMLPFGFADCLFSTLDYSNLVRTLRIYARHSLRSIKHKPEVK